MAKNYLIILSFTMLLFFISAAVISQEMKNERGDLIDGYGLLKEVFRDTPFDFIDPRGNYVESILHHPGNFSIRSRGIIRDQGKAGSMGGKWGGSGMNHRYMKDGRNSFYMGYGVLLPLADYGKRYKNSAVHSLYADFDNHAVMNVVPEVVMKSSSLSSRERPERASSSFSFFQLSLGLLYPVKTGLMVNKSRVTAYGRITDGITRISFEYGGRRSRIVEYVHTLEISWGILFFMTNDFIAGIDSGYRYIATFRVPMQSFNIALMAGLRI